MMNKAWCNVEEVPYKFSRSSIKFQGHAGWKIDDLNPIWVRLLGRSQLSNPSDLPCSSTHCVIVATPYDDTDLGQHWLRWRHGALRHYLNQYWLIINEFCGTHLGPMLQDVPKISIRKMSLRSTLVKVLPHLSGPKQLCQILSHDVSYEVK